MPAFTNNLLFGGQQQASANLPPIDLNSIYGGMGSTFDPDALRKALVSRFAGSGNQGLANSTLVRAKVAPVSTYVGEVTNGMNDFAQMIRNMGGFNGTSNAAPAPVAAQTPATPTKSGAMLGNWQLQQILANQQRR